MKRSIYLFSSGSLRRKDNTLLFESENGKRVIPVKNVSDINVFGELDLNKRVLELLTMNKIILHFFNYYGFYVGSFYPREYYNSGYIILKQAEHFIDGNKRLYLAKGFVYGAISNMIHNLKYYGLNEKAIKLNRYLREANVVDSISSLMAVEGNARDIYYGSFEQILKNEDFRFDRRTKRPPGNELNALISFGNSLMYVTVLSEIYRTHLDPRIGYLHETNLRSFSLNLDIAEVFKPVVVDRVIFTLINRGQIKSKHFSRELKGVFLTERGMKLFITEYENKLRSTIKYGNLGKVSYRRLIRIECYKLYKHFFGEKDYEPYIMRR